MYLGHGNGWPSPYTYDPNYTTKDGFGLNYDVNGDGKLSDYENKYYGEPSIRTLTPGAERRRPAVPPLLRLGQLRARHAAPSLSTAKKRVDNYAAAFIKAGARAVIANGHSHNPYYIDALFTTRQTIDEYWRNAPDFHNKVKTYGSIRNPGYTYQLDPESSSSYYRSIAGQDVAHDDPGHGRRVRQHLRRPGDVRRPRQRHPEVRRRPGLRLRRGARPRASTRSPRCRCRTTVRIEGQEWWRRRRSTAPRSSACTPTAASRAG